MMAWNNGDNMKIKRSIERIPGGMMLVPLLLGSALHTFWPDTGKYLSLIHI